jgi:hypothetical protein
MAASHKGAAFFVDVGLSQYQPEAASFEVARFPRLVVISMANDL